MKRFLAVFLLIFLFVVAFADGGEGIDGNQSGDLENTEPGVVVVSGDSPESADPDAAPEVSPVIDPSTPVIIEADQVVLYDNTIEQFAFSSDVLNGGYYFSVDTRELGQVSIFVPYEYQYGSFTTNNSGNLVSLRSSTVTGVMYDDNYSYTIRWTAFSIPQYRRSEGTGYSYDDLTVTDILSTNIEVLEDYNKIPLFPNSDLVQLLMLLGIGVIIVCLFMKR